MAERTIEVDLANERVVLATMIHERADRRRLSLDLDPDEFGDEAHREIFQALRKMARQNLEWSEDTLVELAGSADRIGGFELLRAIISEYEASPNVDYHVERLRLDSAKFRLLQTTLPELTEGCQEPATTAAELASIMRKEASRLDHASRRFSRRGKRLRDRYYEELRYRNLVGAVVEGSGFPLLDRGLTRGFITGISILVGRPGHGKTTWLANLIRMRASIGKGTYVCGWEMNDVDYLDMMISGETGIPAVSISRDFKTLPRPQKERVCQAVEKFTDPNLLVIEENPFTKLPKPEDRWQINDRNVDYLESVIQQECSRFQFFAIDVIGKLLHDRRPAAIAEALVRIREIAFAHGVHVMLLHHLNRDAATGRPTMEGIKGSGAFEEEADIILATDRPILRASPGRRAKMKDYLDVIMLKQRKGPAPFMIRYRFDGEHYTLSDETEIDVAMLEEDDDDEASV